MNKKDDIKHLFYVPSRYGCIQKTLAHAKQIDNNIKLEDLKMVC